MHDTKFALKCLKITPPSTRYRCFYNWGNALTERRRPLSQMPPKQSRVKFNLPGPPKPPDPPMTEVKDLCSSLDQARQHRKILQVYLSPHGSLCSCYIPPTSGRVLSPDDSSDQMITLEQILLQTSRESSSMVNWTLIQRMNLSFNLASSLLQLYYTPWLSEPWTKRNICFWRLRTLLTGQRYGSGFRAISSLHYPQISWSSSSWSIVQDISQTSALGSRRCTTGD